MKLITNVLVFCIAVFYSANANFEVISPKNNSIFCEDKPIEFILNSNADNYEIRAYNTILNKVIKMYGVEKVSNSLIWIPNDYDLFDVAINFRIYNKNNPDDYFDVNNIKIYSKPRIIEQTKSFIICSGENIILNIEALGNINKYQWYKDGNPIKNENGSQLIINNVKYENSGVYICEIIGDNICGNIQSNPIPIYVLNSTKFISKPDDIEWSYLDTIRVVAPVHINYDFEKDNIKFKWYKDTIITIIVSQDPLIVQNLTKQIELVDNAKYSGCTTECLQIIDVTYQDRAKYTCYAEGMCGSDTTSFELGKTSTFKIIKMSPDYFDCEGSDVTFKIEVETELTDAKFKYRWYKLNGNKLLSESTKYIGTKTTELTIRNATYQEDQNQYYCLVTLENKKVNQRSEPFSYFPTIKPQIFYQTKYWSMKGERNYLQGRAYLQVNVKSYSPCKYEFYRNGKLVNVTIDKDFYGGTDSASFVGKYLCKVSNNCGEVWSDTMYVAYGYDRVNTCLGNDVTLSSTFFGENYSYIWKKNNVVINDGDKYHNSTKYQLTIKNTSISDKDIYNIWAINNDTGEEIYLGSISLYISYGPYIVKDLPEVFTNGELDFIKQIPLSVISPDETIEYELYLDGVSIEKGIKKKLNNNYDDFGFVFGGKSSNIKSGIYQYRFKDKCGETWTRKMQIINTAYKPGGIVITGISDNFSDDIIISYANNFIIYPNPAAEFINILFSEDFMTARKNNISETIYVKIYNIIGVELFSESIYNVSQNYMIDIQNLPKGIYYIKIADRIEKFIKM